MNITKFPSVIYANSKNEGFEYTGEIKSELIYHQFLKD